MIAVTTHSRVKGVRHTLPMLLAGRRIERELRDAPGCARYANIIAGPREFWTLTIWLDSGELRRCTRGGAHGQAMWRQPYWVDSYWGMRWRPGRHRAGQWEGGALPWPDRPEPAVAVPPEDTPAAPAPVPMWMQVALGQTVRVDRRKLGGTAGATYRLRVPLWRLPAALRDLRRLRRIVSGGADAFRLCLGLGTAGALYLLVVATSGEALERLRDCPEHERFLQRWSDRLWLSTWEPESEFGHWNGEKLRDGRLAADRPLVDQRLASRLDAPRHARKALRAGLPRAGRRSITELELLTSELVANSVRHAGLGPDDLITLQVRARGDWVRVDVIDRGTPFEPHVPVAKSPHDCSGWGLHILDKVADSWGIIDGQPDRRTWFELRVRDAD